MKKILKPDFLEAIDRWLMLHKPSLWMINLHYVLYYVLIATIVQTMIALVYPIDFRHTVDVEVLYGFVLVPVLLCGVLWIVKMVRYNIHHTYTKRSIYKEFGVFLLNAFVLTLIMSQTYVMPTILNWKIGHTITEQEDQIVDKGFFYLGRNSYDRDHKAIREVKYNDGIYTLSYQISSRLEHSIANLDTVDFFDQREERIWSDSLGEYIGDTVVIDTNQYYQSKISKEELIKVLDDLKGFHNGWYPEAKINLSSERIISDFIMQKRNDAYDSLTVYTYDCTWKPDYNHVMTRHYHNSVDYVHERIRPYERAKYWEKDIFELDEAIRATFWCIVALSFLLWIVSLVRWQQLLMTAITIALSPILIGLIGVTLFGLMKIDDDYIPVFILVIYLVFLWQAIKSHFRDRITSYQNVITVLVTMCFPAIPLLLTAWWWIKTWQEYKYYQAERINGVAQVKLIYGYDYDIFESALFLSGEALTFVFVFLAIAIFSPILKKHYALPKNN